MLRSYHPTAIRSHSPTSSSFTRVNMNYRNLSNVNSISLLFHNLTSSTLNSTLPPIRTFSQTNIRRKDRAGNPQDNTNASENLSNVNGLCLDAGGYIIPHPSKQHRGGEDAYFIARGPSTDAIGVADGVGGWQRQGIDPGPFSRHLMQAAGQAVVNGVDDPFNIISKAFYNGVFNQYIGSSTCCLALLHNNRNILETVNIGDSAVMVLRKEKNSKNPKIIGGSIPLVAGFNAPFQLTNLVSKIDGTDLSRSHKSNLSVDPENGTPSDIEIKHGDMVVMASDGFFDNVHNTELLQEVSSCFVDPMTPKACAQKLAKFAFELSNDKKRLSPFAEEALQHRMRYRGGKPDDITVLVARIINGEEIEQSETILTRGTYEFQPTLGVNLNDQIK